MEKRFLNSKTKRFYFNNGEKDVSYVAIHGDELEVNPSQDGTTNKKRDAV